MVAEVLPQEPSIPLRVLALALLENRQDPLPPLLGRGEVPHHQLHHQLVLVAQWDTVALPPAGRLTGGRQDAAKGGPALPEEAKTNQDRAEGLPSKFGRPQCVAGLPQRLLDRLSPLVMSDLGSLHSTLGWGKRRRTRCYRGESPPGSNPPRSSHHPRTWPQLCV